MSQSPDIIHERVNLLMTGFALFQASIQLCNDLIETVGELAAATVEDDHPTAPSATDAAASKPATADAADGSDFTTA